MHATSTPTLAQTKPSAFGAIAAAALAVGIAAGAIAAVNLAPATGSATSESGSVTQIERGLQLQRQGEIAVGVTSAYETLRAAGGWYAFQPLEADGNAQPVGVSHR